MKIVKLILFSLMLLTLQSCKNDQSVNDIFTIYLVRHAEKDLGDKKYQDPSLTLCGKQRANSLDKFLKKIDIDRVYSSDYLRTKNTGMPTAKSKGLKIELYNPGDLFNFSNLLLERKENVLVIGHSNTTPILAGLLVGEDLQPMDEKIYDRIYQVALSKKTGKLQIFQSAFECEN